ncbi:hypothetical protein CC86DRAFT_412074 [Ophiobolus disseminans]|uniref:Uncharacterized protein n=1 Tax=Ophiobolus disseminans TaxID=1469910 RepID=A0A6A6ZIP9_9PLEO|nr:hypothetical protein CC86DRAFT_412074 [Ophiobolus disseminans]
MFMAYLMEYDLAPTPTSEFTEQSYDKPASFSKKAQVLSWVMLSKSCRSNILNARVTSRKLYDASSKAFAALLGYRNFRFTEVGTEGLRRIGQAASIVPYVTTITIGCAGFRHGGVASTLMDIPMQVKYPDHERMLQAYDACVQWQNENLLNQQEQLAALIRVFPNFSAVRMNGSDRPTYLGGWLQPTDVERFEH